MVFHRPLMKQDRFLILLLIGIGLLIIAAILIFFIRKRDQAYQSDQTPENILRNYVLAIQLEDYSKAYDYLEETSDKPDFSSYQETLDQKWGPFAKPH